MREFTCDPNLELYGVATRSLIENMNYDLVRPHLAQHGLDDIDPDGWYSMQSILNVFTALRAQGGAMADFVAIGMKAAELSALPPELEQMSFAAFMSLYGEKIYPTRHRNGDAGAFTVEIVSEKALKVTITNVYPDDVMYGLVYGFARRFLGRDGVHFIAMYDEEIVRRDEDGAQTIIHVTWGA